MSLSILVAVTLVSLWVLPSIIGKRGNSNAPALEEHPGAPWWKYDPTAEVATIWGDRTGDSGDAIARSLSEEGVTVIEVGSDAVLAALRPWERACVERLGYCVVTVENRTITGRGDYRFDTLYGEPAMPDELHVNLTQSPNYDKFLLQLVGPVMSGWRDVCQSMGVKIFGYLPYNSYLVQMNSTLPESLTELYFVQWVGAYQPAYKIQGILINSTEAWHDITLIMFPSSDSSDQQRVSDIITASGGQVHDSWTEASAGPVFVAHVPHRLLIGLVQDPEVSWIERHFDSYIFL